MEISKFTHHKITPTNPIEELGLRADYGAMHLEALSLAGNRKVGEELIAIEASNGFLKGFGHVVVESFIRSGDGES